MALDILCTARKATETGLGVVGQQGSHELLCVFIKLAWKVHRTLINLTKGVVAFRGIERCLPAHVIHRQEG